MTTEHFLWAIFVLLWVALVLVVVTARRGPWERRITTNPNTFQERDRGVPMHGGGLPDGTYIYRIDSPTQVTLRRRRRRVHPLWGKSQWRP